MNKNLKSVRGKLLTPLLTYTCGFLVILFLFLAATLKYFFSFAHYSVPVKVLEQINLIFLSIIAVFIIGFAIIAIYICNSISNSIVSLSNDAKRLVESSYRTDNLKLFDYKEAQDLNININKLAKKLNDYHKLQKTVIANASHELRTPLMSIQGYAEGIKYNVFEDINEPLDIIINESVHIRELIKSIIKLSELDSNNLNIERKNINLYSTLNRMANGLRGLAFKEDKIITIVGDKKINIEVDENLLEEAFNNLISNAIRYSHKNINVSFEKSDNNTIIHIQDDGEGINEKDIESIFTRYYKGKQGNFGLGLSIAQSAINYLNGEIRAYNTEFGACFDIILSKE